LLTPFLHEALPPAGVYAAFGLLDDCRVNGMVHIGQRPTFGDKEKSIEVHFLDFNRNIYGCDIELIFLEKLRDIRTFPNPQALAKQIQKDIHTAKGLILK
jgi:riboflavin kinase/FMN adenylyltransferase